MSKMVWDQIGERVYETGVEQVALFPQEAGTYPKGVPWNGVTALNITPSGAESTPLYANNSKYGEVTSAEEVGFGVEAYIYPDEWAECDGSVAVADGMYIGQQPRKPFGLVGKNLIGNDVEGTKYGYKLHILYGAKAKPAEQSNSTINESIEAKTMSWECTTTPVAIDGYNNTSHIYFDSTKVDKDKLAALEAIIYGSTDGEPRLPLPTEVFEIMGVTTAG